MKVVPRPPGPAYANLQGREPRDAGRDEASDAMGIWVPRVTWLIWIEPIQQVVRWWNGSSRSGGWDRVR